MPADPQILRARLAALHADLAQLSSSEACAWALARVFNVLLAETRDLVGEDPILAVMGSAKVAEKNALASTASHGSLCAMVGQLIAALDAPFRRA